MTKVALINDLHAGIRNDVSWMLDYQEKFFKNVFFPSIKENGITTVLIGGDVFDRRKFVNFSTLKRFKSFFFDVLEKENITVKIIPGNHDCYYKTSNEVNSLEELLGKYKNVEICMEPVTLTYDNSTIDFLPWISPENEERVMDFVKKSKSEFCYGHLEFAGFELLKGIKSEHGMNTNTFKKYKQVWSGHYHHKSSQGNIYYLGAPCEFTFADWDCDRGFHIFDASNKTVEFIKNPYSLHEKIFYNDEDDYEQWKNLDFSKYNNKITRVFVIKKVVPAMYDFFIDKLHDCDTISLSVIEDYTGFEGSNVEFGGSGEEIASLSTKDFMTKYIESVETDLDKEILKRYVSELYIQAMHISQKSVE